MDIMLDLETWGTTPGSDIRSIGACVFDPVTGFTHDGSLGTIRPFYIACDNPVRDDARPQYSDPNAVHADRCYPLFRDTRTVQWWSEQSDEAQAAFTDPVDLRDALLRLTSWIINVYPGPWDGKLTPNIKIWSHGAAFDPPILAAAYEAVGLPVLWHYRAPRDTRTLFDAAGIEDHSALLARHPGPLGLVHHALDDAICQARAVCAAYSRLRSPDREFHVGRIAMQQYANWTNQPQDIGGAWAEIERAIQET